MFRSKWKGQWSKFLFIFLVVIGLVTITCLWDFIGFLYSNEKIATLNCFELPGNKIPQLDENEPKPGNGIYFHETTCPKDMTDIPLNARQACSVESALRAHPDTDVFLLISSPIFEPLEKIRNVLVKHLLSYSNFKIRHITFSQYLSNTPLQVIHETRALNRSYWPVPHSSDVLRYATLYKFGGIYLDLDVIVLKSLTELRNFAGAESHNIVGSGILGFDFDKTGREVAKKCAEDLARSFDGSIWGSNGPGVITRVLRKICKTSSTKKMFKKHCKGFKVYPRAYFSALSYNEPEFFFTEGNTLEAQKALNRSLVIHYWNKLSSKFTINNNRSDIPFLRYAQTYCPGIYGTVKGYF